MKTCQKCGETDKEFRVDNGNTCVECLRKHSRQYYAANKKSKAYDAYKKKKSEKEKASRKRLKIRKMVRRTIKNLIDSRKSSKPIKDHEFYVDNKTWATPIEEFDWSYLMSIKMSEIKVFLKKR